MFPLSDGSSTQCDPDGENPCCDSLFYGTCGNTVEHCSSCVTGCVNYSRLYEEWRQSGGKQKWRYDGRLGKYYPLPDGSPAECNPGSDKPCAKEKIDYCSSDEFTENYSDRCLCSTCVDYRYVEKVRQSGKKCAFVEMNRFLQTMCIEMTTKKRIRQYFKCAHSNTYYQINRIIGTVSRICKNDHRVYQACGMSSATTITNSEVLCGGYFCRDEARHNKVNLELEFTECTGETCRAENNNSTCVKQNDQDVQLCNDVCDAYYFCEDESFCNGYTYGGACNIYPELGEKFDSHVYRYGYRLCDGLKCHSFSNILTCIDAESSLMKCVQYDVKISFNETFIVPIVNYTRCTVLDRSKGAHPYCLNYLDQTNCSDTRRVGGFCEVNGFMANVSKYMVCNEFDQTLNKSIKLCDDNLQNRCVTPFPTCQIHKHRMCDGMKDCSDNSDEIDDTCELTTDKFDFRCTRRFLHRIGDIRIPASWILDNDTDCMNGEDENTTFWRFCAGPFKAISIPDEKCQNVFKCPGDEESYVLFDNLCDGVESCGDKKSSENELCKIAREFPVIKKTAPLYSGAIRDLCVFGNGSACQVREYKRPWGDVFGEQKIKLRVPESKVNCSELFGEYYLFLSCMNLCLEPDAACLLSNNKRRLEHDSCPGKYPDRSYTIANNSFLTFVDKSKSGRYSQDIFKCDNGRCVGYTNVCDLIDDCGDMSDEINCTNHMICEDSLNLTEHQFISLSQRCDGIYDCFDLSDECNNDCGKEILGNWVIKFMCWSMGILASLFNFVSVIRGFDSLRECQTEQFMISKALVSLIGLGDLLVGLYLVILSLYDSLIGDQYCRHQVEWLTGTSCLTLGVISTLGSQLSLFTMTVLSVVRMYGLIFKSLKVPSRDIKKGVIRIALLGISTIGAAFAIAVTPLVPWLQDYFVQGMYFDSSYKVFIGFKNKYRLIKIIETYYESNTYKEANSSMSMSWNEISDKVNGMFVQENGNLTQHPVHFYGNDGVCLFKYFVRTDDARRSRQTTNTTGNLDSFKGDPIVWAMLSVNLFCFILITFCYIVIFYRTKTSSRRSGQQNNPNRLVEEDALQKKIAIIIATDFLSWVPFILISALHNLEYIDASFWYASFTMTVLPLNSVINPLLYDKELAEMLLRNFGKLRLKRKVALGKPSLSAIAGLFRSKTRTFSSGDVNDCGEQSPEMNPIDRLVNNEIAAENKENADTSDCNSKADRKIEDANGLDCNSEADRKIEDAKSLDCNTEADRKIEDAKSLDCNTEADRKIEDAKSLDCNSEADRKIEDAKSLDCSTEADRKIEDAKSLDCNSEADRKIEDADGLDCSIGVHNDEHVEDVDRHVNIDDDTDANVVDHNIDGDTDNTQDVNDVDHDIYADDHEDVDHNIDSENN